MQLRTIIAASAMAAVFSIGTTRALAQSGEARAEFSYTPASAGVASIDVTNTNGSIRIVGTDDAAITVAGEKVVRGDTEREAREGLEKIEIEIEQDGAILRIRTSHPFLSDLSYSAEYEIRVPRALQVTATNTDGEVAVEGMRSQVKATVTNGEIQTREVRGSVDATVANGEINGDVAVPNGGRLALTVTNGEIDSRLAFDGAADCSLTATNGEVNLALDGGSSVKLNAYVGVGSVEVRDLAMTDERRSRNGRVGESMSGTMGGGAASVGVTVSQGSVSLSRAE